MDFQKTNDLSNDGEDMNTLSSISVPFLGDLFSQVSYFFSKEGTDALAYKIALNIHEMEQAKRKSIGTVH